MRYYKWCVQFFINEPINVIEQWFDITIGTGERLRVQSWATRSPVVDLIVERMPQTLWVVGMSYVVGILIAIPIGVISAYKQYSWFDQAGTFVSMVGLFRADLLYRRVDDRHFRGASGVVPVDL